MSDKISLDPRSLRISDLKRAKAGPLGGRNPLELFDDPLESATLVVWCVRSRDDLEFTWADAEQVELGDFSQFHDQPEDEPAPSPDASPGEPSARPEPNESASSSSRPPKRTPSGSSGSSSG